MLECYMMRKSYLGLAMSILLPFAVVGCADDDKNKQIKQQPQVKAVEQPKKIITVEDQARLDLKNQIASCLQVNSKKINEPLERFIGDDIFDLQGKNDNHEFILVIKKVINETIEAEKNKQPITENALDYETQILEESYKKLLKRISSKVVVDKTAIEKGINTDVFSRIIFEYNQGQAINDSVQKCMSIFKNYDENAYDYFMQTTTNERIHAVGVQKINANGTYKDAKGIQRNSWEFRTLESRINIKEKPFKIIVDGEPQDIPILNENWKYQNQKWANLDRLWVDQVLANNNEIYVVLSPDNDALGITPQVYFREVMVFSLDGKIRDRFSYKYPFDLKLTEEISVTPTGFSSRTKESEKNGIFSAVYENGVLNINQLGLASTLGSGSRDKCNNLFEKIYVNEVDFKVGLKMGDIPDIPENLKPYLSDKIKANVDLEKQFFFEVSNKSLTDKLNAPKGSFEKQYCD